MGAATRRLFAAVLLTYIATAGGHLYTTDEEGLFRAAESWAVGRWGEIDDDPRIHLPATRGRDGRLYAYYAPGFQVAAAPLAAAGRAAGAVVPYGAPYAARAVASVMNQVIVAATAALLFAAGRRIAPARAAAAAAIAFAFATYAWPRAKSFGTDPLVGLCHLGAVAALLEGATPRRAFCAGLSGAAAVLTRYDAVVGLATPVILSLASARPAASTAALAAGVAPAPLLLGLYNLHRFGSPLATGYPDVAGGLAHAFSTPLTEGGLGLLMSPGRGLVWHSPASLLGLAGLAILAHKQRTLAAAIGVAFVLHVAVFGKALAWHGGAASGPRLLYPVFPLVALASVPLFARVFGGAGRGLRAAVGIVVAAGLAVQILAVVASPDTQNDRLVEAGLTSEAGIWSWPLSPWPGQVRTLRELTWGRVALGEDLLPAGGGHAWTQELRRSVDVWAVYAYKVGVPAWLCLALWGANVAAAAWAWRRVAEAVRAA